MTKPAIINNLKKLTSSKDVDFSLLIRKNGDILVKVGIEGGPSTGELGTFAATGLGGIIQAQKRMSKKYPKQVLIKDSDGLTVIDVVTKDVFLLVRLNSVERQDQMLKKIDNLGYSISHDL